MSAIQEGNGALRRLIDAHPTCKERKKQEKKERTGNEEREKKRQKIDTKRKQRNEKDGDGDSAIMTVMRAVNYEIP